MSRRLGVRLAATLAALLTCLGAASPAGSSTSITLTAGLTGGATEVAAPGDPDGTGTAVLRLNPAKRTLCFKITLRRVGMPTVGAHVHEGPKGKIGPIVTGLLGTASSKTTRAGCARRVSPALLRRIGKRPSAFYVNVHTEPIPTGAVRGQIRRSRSR